MNMVAARRSKPRHKCPGAVKEFARDAALDLSLWAEGEIHLENEGDHGITMPGVNFQTMFLGCDVWSAKLEGSKGNNVLLNTENDILGMAVLKYHQGRNTGGCMDGCAADHSAGCGTPL